MTFIFNNFITNFMENQNQNKERKNDSRDLRLFTFHAVGAGKFKHFPDLNLTRPINMGDPIYCPVEITLPVSHSHIKSLIPTKFQDLGLNQDRNPVQIPVFKNSEVDT